MRWTRGRSGRPFNFLNYKEGEGEVISGEMPELEDRRVPQPLTSPEVLAVNTLRQLAALSQAGDNLANVVQFLREQRPDRLERIFEALRRRVPHLERFEFQTTADGRLLLLLKDAPFEQPILARYASDGTLKLLAYL